MWKYTNNKIYILYLFLCRMFLPNALSCCDNAIPCTTRTTFIHMVIMCGMCNLILMACAVYWQRYNRSWSFALDQPHLVDPQLYQLPNGTSINVEEWREKKATKVNGAPQQPTRGGSVWTSVPNLRMDVLWTFWERVIVRF